MVKRMNIKIEVNGDIAELYTPYNQDFVNKIKGIGGAKWISSKKCWSIPSAAADAAREIMRSVFGVDDISPAETVKLRITTLEELSEPKKDVNLFGKCLCHAWGRDSGGTAGQDVCYVAGAPCSSGSVKNWYSTVPSGSVIILNNVSKPLYDTYEPSDYIKIELISEDININALKIEKEQLLKRLEELNALLERQGGENGK